MFRISHLLVVRWTVDAGRGVRLCAESHQTCDFGYIALDQISPEQAFERGGLDLERLVGPRDTLLSLEDHQGARDRLARRANQVGEFLVRRAWLDAHAGASRTPAFTRHPSQSPRHALRRAER